MVGSKRRSQLGVGVADWGSGGSCSTIVIFCRFQPQAGLGGCTCEYPEDYYHKNDDAKNNREHLFHPLSGGFFDQTACRLALS